MIDEHWPSLIRLTLRPLAQLALMWVSEHTPALADRVLEASRAHYEQAEPQAT